MQIPKQHTCTHTQLKNEPQWLFRRNPRQLCLPGRVGASVRPRYIPLAWDIWDWHSASLKIGIWKYMKILGSLMENLLLQDFVAPWDVEIFQPLRNGGAPTLEEPLKSEPRNKTSSRAVQTWSTKVHQSGMYSSSPSFDRFLLTARKNCQWKPAKMVQQNHDKLRSNQNVHGQVGLVSFSCKVENTGGEGRVCKFAVWGCHYTKHFREGWWLAIYCRIWYDWLKTTQKIWERNREMANLLWSKQWWRSIVVACLRRL